MYDTFQYDQQELTETKYESKNWSIIEEDIVVLFRK